jgi:hypothetical protein
MKPRLLPIGSVDTVTDGVTCLCYEAAGGVACMRSSREALGENYAHLLRSALSLGGGGVSRFPYTLTFKLFKIIFLQICPKYFG